MLVMFISYVCFLIIQSTALFNILRAVPAAGLVLDDISSASIIGLIYFLNYCIYTTYLVNHAHNFVSERKMTTWNILQTCSVSPFCTNAQSQLPSPFPEVINIYLYDNIYPNCDFNLSYHFHRRCLNPFLSDSRICQVRKGGRVRTLYWRLFAASSLTAFAFSSFLDPLRR